MSGTSPVLTIGLPVYNGEQFLPGAVDSLLTQTREDFILVIADNCSTDRTQEIARHYESTDNRVSYIRRDSNIGASANYNELAIEAKTPYFKWAASDDLHANTFFERCLSILEADASAIGAYPRTVRINEDSEIVSTETYRLRTNSPLPHIRFRGITAKPHSCFSIFGVFRTNVLQDTQLIRTRSHGDRILLAELALRGRLVEHPSYLLSRRLHEASFSSGSNIDEDDRERFWTGSKAAAAPKTSSLEAAYLEVIECSPLTSSERHLCERELRLRAVRKFVLRKFLRPLRRRAIRLRTSIGRPAR